VCIDKVNGVSRQRQSLVDDVHLSVGGGEQLSPSPAAAAATAAVGISPQHSAVDATTSVTGLGRDTHLYVLLMALAL